MKGTEFVSVQGIVNYDPSCPSRILIKDLKKVVTPFADSLDKTDIPYIKGSVGLSDADAIA